MIKKNCAALIFATLVSGACGNSSDAGAWTEIETKVSELTAIQQSRIRAFSGSCDRVLRETVPANDSAAAIAAAVVPILSNTAIDLITAYLETAEAEKSGTFSADGQIQNLDEGTCIVVVRGPFGDLESASSLEGRLTHEALANLDLAGIPDFAFFVDSRYERPNIRVVPFYLHYAKSSAKKRGRGKKHIAIKLEFSFLAHPQSDSGGQSALAQLNHLDLSYFFEDVPVGSFADGKAITSGPKLIWAPDHKPENTIAISASVTETENAVLALKVLAENLSEQKSEISSSVTRAAVSAFTPPVEEDPEQP